MSSSDIAVSVRGLSKAYTIAHNAAKHTTAGEALMHRLKHPLQKTEKETFWALRDVEFDIKKGDVVGIIGRNGAGKSTLLKILSRITTPTTGRIALYGRVGSLLEVGTGFHPELTGRENIYLNGAILGMSKREITREFDAIVDFSGTEQFLDTPVKRYSSGMYIRLAFAVAAHLNPEILIVDEVLAVGDTEFQKKCLSKMEDVGKQGRTVLFVSHSMPMVLRLCNRVIVMEKGSTTAQGSPTQMMSYYLSGSGSRAAERVWPLQSSAPGDAVARLHSVRVLDDHSKISENINIDTDMYVEVEYWNLQTTLKTVVSIHIVNEIGVTLFASNDWNNKAWSRTPPTVGLIKARCTIPKHLLTEGRHFVLAAVCTYNPDVVHAIEHDAVSFQCIESRGTEDARGEFAREWPGVVRPLLNWEISVDQKVSTQTTHDYTSALR